MEGQSEQGAQYQQLKHEKKKVVVLGTGWAGISFLKKLNVSSYDVHVVSPNNYFTFTPLLPSVTCGTVESRSIVEPIRNIIKKKAGLIQYWEGECVKIDEKKKEVYCRAINKDNLEEKGEFPLLYDYLVIAVGTQANTSKVSGDMKNCHFMKEVGDAQKIRRSLIECFERAVLPDLREKEREAILRFVIVGGGPTGVAFAAELHDFVHEDLIKLYPSVRGLAKIILIHSEDHILNKFDERVSSFAEQKFKRDGVEVWTGFRVLEVRDKKIKMKSKSKGDISFPYGMLVWSTGVGVCPVVKDFIKTIGQESERALATDEWLCVKKCNDVYALGDCATIEQRKLLDEVVTIFRGADTDNSGTLSAKEIPNVLQDICRRYPQMDLYLKKKRLRQMFELDSDADGVMNIEEFKEALSKVDSKMKSLPQTAQVAAQQGEYLSWCFNNMASKDNQGDPVHFEGSGHHQFRPFRYKHLGQFVSMGSEPIAELPWDWIIKGPSTRWLWYSVYAIKQVSWRTRLLVIFDWTKRFIFGRDTSGI